MSTHLFAPTDPADGEIILTNGTFEARIARWGASLRGVWQEGAEGSQTPLVTGYTGRAQKAGGQGDVLIPFPGRVRGGRYSWDGETYQMPLNDKESPGAIHGFLRARLWDVAEQNTERVTFTTGLVGTDTPGYPFDLEALVTYEVTGDGFQCQFAITNRGDKDAPVGAGFHPYFTVGSDTIDEDTLHLPFSERLEFDGLLPTGQVLPVAGTEYDFLSPRAIGAVVLNTCFASPVRDANGLTRIRLARTNTGRALVVWMDEAFSYVVLYSGDPLPDSHRRRALAIEPMTCGSDAFNFPDFGLTRLTPGNILSGAWGVTPS